MPTESIIYPSDTVVVPNVIGLEVDAARSRLLEAQLASDVVGEGTVVDQDPDAGERVPRTYTVTLTARPEPERS